MPAVAITTRDDWVRAGYELLDARGVAGVSIDRLAPRCLGFYHRFADRSELIDAIVDHWMAEGYALVERHQNIEDPLDRYGSTISGLLTSPALRRSDTALLLLATGDEGFGERRDRVRNDFIVLGGELLQRSGMAASLARTRAHFVWMGYLGILGEVHGRSDVPTDEELDALARQLIERATT